MSPFSQWTVPELVTAFSKAIEPLPIRLITPLGCTLTVLAAVPALQLAVAPPCTSNGPLIEPPLQLSVAPLSSANGPLAPLLKFNVPLTALLPLKMLAQFKLVIVPP